jgi:cell pole-organizing protein PopZ
MPEQPAQEPTMDEILASIRRIITDDEPAEEEAQAPEAADASAGSAPAKGKAEEAPSVNEVEASSGQTTKAESSKKSSDDAVNVSEKEMADTKVGDQAGQDASLVGDKVATDTSAAFAKLSVAVKESSGEPSMTMPAPGRSLEDVVRELLRPILKEWLETHLPEIVREHVEEEVARISRGSRAR